MHIAPRMARPFALHFRERFAFATPVRLQEAAYARNPPGGLMRRPTRLAGGCGQKRPLALLTEPFFLLALYANALLCAAP